jgi:hypothetical protein
MNRRHFLSALTASLTGLTLDPERLLWIPGAKTIFLPSITPRHDPACLTTMRLVYSWDPSPPYVEGFGISFMGPSPTWLGTVRG